MTAPANRDDMPLVDDAPAHLGDVLVVEDTPASLKLLSDLLGAAGYRVRQAPDGALALWSATALPPELILLDIRMPGIDGFEVCRRLKAEPALAAVPVVFLSAQSDVEDKVRGFQAGAVDFIAKPYQAEEVLARVGAHIRLARTQQALAAANGELGDALAQLRAARLDAERAQRLAALGALVAGVAHELNTPIGNGLLAASALDERTALFMAALDSGVRRSALEQFGADTRHACALLLRSLERASGLIDRFKQVAADQGGCERRRFALGPLLEDLLAGSRHDAQRIALRLDMAAQARSLDMDSFPAALGQVLLQLLRNALLHGLHEDGSGDIVIAVAPPHDGLVLLSVGDNGGGIAPASLDKIFEPFFTTRFGQGGGGLGLHIVHNLVVNVLGGSITAESEPGRTRFLLRLPIQAPQLGLEPSAPGAMSALRGPV